MEKDELFAEKALRKATYESKTILSSMSALELCNKAAALQKAIHEVMISIKLPQGLAVGVLVGEIADILRMTDDLSQVAALEMLKRYDDRNVAVLKKYIDDNFMKKE